MSTKKEICVFNELEKITQKVATNHGVNYEENEVMELTKFAFIGVEKELCEFRNYLLESDFVKKAKEDSRYSGIMKSISEMENDDFIRTNIAYSHLIQRILRAPLRIFAEGSIYLIAPIIYNFLEFAFREYGLINARQFHLIGHSLGCPYLEETPKEYKRNRFCAEIGGHDYFLFEQLVKNGFAEKGQTINEMSSSFFFISEKGKRAFEFLNQNGGFLKNETEFNNFKLSLKDYE